jgi:hypothetical protein
VRFRFKYLWRQGIDTKDFSGSYVPQPQRRQPRV